MSRIDDLITELCPDGVEFRPLGEYLDYQQPTKYLVASTEYDNSFKTPVLTAGQTFILGYTDETQGIYPASSDEPVIIFDDFTTAFKWVDFPFKAKSSAMKMLRPRQNAAIDFRYVYYAMLCIGYSPQDHARHWIAKYSQFKIPVPPIEVQREIVRILDTFGRLEAELEAELEARRKQYTFYRDQLLTFTERERERERRIRWATMTEICSKISSGATPLTTRASFYQGGTIPWLRTQEVVWRDIYDTEIKITEKAVKETAAKWIPENCVIVAISGATAGRSGVNKIPLTTNQHCCNMEIDPTQASYRYVFHWITANYARLRALGRGARSDLNMGLIKTFPIAIPSLEEQERIAELLDKFDILVNDLSSGLPAELNARRQQYEHYRDRLLTFQEAT